jgi:lysophospholipid acyltransferase (LPLAT)-like uncharacterized protein
VAAFRLRHLTSRPWFQQTAGVAASGYLRLIWRTSRVRFEPPDIYDRIRPDLPIIVTLWHGQHFMLPMLKRDEHRFKTLISHHRDGTINAIAAERLGIGVIRGSGTHGKDFDRKGGVPAFREMLAALNEGYGIGVTADVPKVSRVCGLGVVMLASKSGRPIYPMAIANARRIELNNWDRSALPLPFGRMVVVVGEPVRLPPDPGDAQLEAARQTVENSLNEVNARAYAIADRTQGDADRG